MASRWETAPVSKTGETAQAALEGSTPSLSAFRDRGSANGKRAGFDPANEGSSPSPRADDPAAAARRQDDPTSIQDGEDVVLGHDEMLDAVDGHLGAGVGTEQNAIAF